MVVHNEAVSRLSDKGISANRCSPFTYLNLGHVDIPSSNIRIDVPSLPSCDFISELGSLSRT